MGSAVKREDLTFCERWAFKRFRSVMVFSEIKINAPTFLKSTLTFIKIKAKFFFLIVLKLFDLEAIF